MTAILEKAFRAASRLPPRLQEELANQLFEDMAGEAAWDVTLATDASQDLLQKMADRAIKASRERKTQRKGFGEL